MKRQLTLTVLIATLTFVLMAFMSSPDGGGPKKVAKKFLKAYEKADWDKAKTYASSETKDAINTIAGMSKGPTNRKVSIIREEITDNSSAMVYYSLDGGETKSLKMIDVGGAWLVSATKIDLPSYNTTGNDDTSKGKKVKLGKGAKTLTAFLEAVENGDWDKAKEFGTEKTVSAIETLVMMDAAPSHREFTITREEKISATELKVYYQFTGEEETRSSLLLKQDGDWKVAMSKNEIHESAAIPDDLGESLAEGMEEETATEMPYYETPEDFEGYEGELEKSRDMHFSREFPGRYDEEIRFIGTLGEEEAAVLTLKSFGDDEFNRFGTLLLGDDEKEYKVIGTIDEDLSFEFYVFAEDGDTEALINGFINHNSKFVGIYIPNNPDREWLKLVLVGP